MPDDGITGPAGAPQFQIAAWAPQPPRLAIVADDGTELLVITTDGGQLHVSGDESHWTEAAQRFVTAVRDLLGMQVTGDE